MLGGQGKIWKAGCGYDGVSHCGGGGGGGAFVVTVALSPLPV